MGFNSLDPADVVDVTFVGDLYGQTILNTLHYYCEPTAWYNPSLVTGMADIETQITLPNGVRDKFLACCSADYTLVRHRMQVISPVRKAYFDTVDGSVGTHPAPAGSPNIAANLELRTLEVIKPSHRNFWVPAVPSDAYVAGELDADYLGQLDVLGNRLMGVLAPGGSQLVPVCFTRAAVANKTRQITFFTLHNEVRVLTRRTVRRGE